jgi:hypothetical protein
MTQQEAEALTSQIKRITDILDRQGIKYRFYLQWDGESTMPLCFAEKFYLETDYVIGILEKYCQQIDLINGRYELDVSGVGVDIGSNWNRNYFGYWSIPLHWMLKKKFQDEFEHVLSMKRIKSLFQ